MAIRTNSKQAKANLTAYILEWVADDIEDSNAWAKDGERVYNPEDPADVAAYILAEFKRGTAEWERNRYGWREAFLGWSCGLPLGGLFCYHYNRSAKEDVAALLDETEKERDRFTESEAEKFLTERIFEWCLNHDCK